MRIVTTTAMRAAEQRAVEEGASYPELMDRAGRGVAEAVQNLLGGVRGKRVVVLVGSGNNGGDGLVAASALAERGAVVTVGVVGRREAADPLLDTVRRLPIAECDLSAATGQAAFAAALFAADLAIDSLFGTGLSRPISGVAADALTLLNNRPGSVPLVAIDVPSGLHPDTGLTDPLTPYATLTVTLAAPKVGMFLLTAPEHVGRFEIVDIGIADDYFDDTVGELITREYARANGPWRYLTGHKGTFGKTLVIAGSERYVGAAILSALGALRSGAGFVTIATPLSVYRQLAGVYPEPTFLPLPEDPAGHIAADAVAVTLTTAESYDSVVIGPGLGRAPGSDAFLTDVVPRLPIPSVIDADAINVLATKPNWPTLLPPSAVLTPHSGELARLLQTTPDAIDRDRIGVARSNPSGAVLVLKGPHTIVSDPFGALWINERANPALATAGTGDVLAGVIGGLLAQGESTLQAATVGVWLHGAAAKLWSEQNGIAGMVASDLLAFLPRARRSITEPSR